MFFPDNVIITGINSKMPKKIKKETIKKSSKAKYVYTIGRRKQAVAIVRLFKGKGGIVVNDMPIAEYFPGLIGKYSFDRPFELTKTIGKFHATIKVRGSGKQSQLEAVVLALSRAIQKSDPIAYRSILKKEKLLTVDSRVRERRKAGQMGRARKKKQSPKR